MKIALATCTDLPHLDGDEAPLVQALTTRGATVGVHPWDGGDAPFIDADISVIRSTWDYTHKVDDFTRWAQRIEDAGVRAGRKAQLNNPASVVRWNTHKRYLATLAREGVPTVPTVFLDAGSSCDVNLLLKQRTWTRGSVVKPSVSAGSRDTVRVDGMDAAPAQMLIDALLPTRDLMVQPFVEGIAKGEVSLHFIDGVFTHAVNKRPKAGEFRSQPEFGSDVTPIVPDHAARQIAARALEVTGGHLLYARVDLVPADENASVPWWLIELELVEPSMYLRHDARAADTFADAILRRAQQNLAHAKVQP